MHSLIPRSDEARKTLEYEGFAPVFNPFHRTYYYYPYDIFNCLS